MSKKGINIFGLLTIFTLILGSFLGAAKGQNVPNPPSQIYDRIGIANWGSDPSGIVGYNTTAGLSGTFGVDYTLPGEIIGYAGINDKIASLKTRTIKIAIGRRSGMG